MTMRLNLLARAIALTLATAALAGCGGDGGSQQTGFLTLGVTDGPVEAAQEVWVQFAGVELKPKGGPAFSIDIVDPASVPVNTRTINLLDFQGTDSALLIPDTEVPAGEYEWIRLKVNAEPVVDDSSIVIDGAECELQIPSGAQTGLKLVRGFTIGVGATTDFTIEFDLRKSITQPPGQGTAAPTCDGEPYVLKPALRIVDNLEVGTISGTVSGASADHPICDSEAFGPDVYGRVYLFGPYTDVVPVLDDMDLNNDPVNGVDNDASDTGPLTTAFVKLDGSSNYAYTIGFVPAGQYVAAYSCSSDNPDIDSEDADTPTGDDEAVVFTPATGTTLVVAAGQTTTVDFEVPVP